MLPWVERPKGVEPVAARTAEELPRRICLLADAITDSKDRRLDLEISPERPTPRKLQPYHKSPSGAERVPQERDQGASGWGFPRSPAICSTVSMNAHPLASRSADGISRTSVEYPAFRADATTGFGDQSRVMKASRQGPAMRRRRIADGTISAEA